MDQLMAGLDDAMTGQGRLLLITGEPGIGKTMMAEELAARAQQRGVRVLWGRCWEGGGAPAYWPWTQVLRSLIEEPPDGADLAPNGETRLIARLIPELADQMGDGDAAPMPAQPGAARFRLFDAVTRLLRRAATRQPLLIVLDDLHAADPASLLLLRFVARSLRSTQLLILAAYRRTQATQRADVIELIGDLVRESPSIRLRGFDRAEVERFMQSLTGVHTAEADVSGIMNATAGNPLFIREMMHLAGVNAPPGWHRQRALSEGVRAVIHQRLAALDADTIQLLSVAAVVGQECEAALVAQVAGVDLADVLHSLAQAEQAELVTPVPTSPTAFRFFHGLVREVLYDDLPLAVRRELHGKVGEAIERLHRTELNAYLGALAYHFAQVATDGYSAKAGDYAARAGDQAMAAHAYEEAALQYQRALDALRLTQQDEIQHLNLLLHLGIAQARAGVYDQAKASFLRAAEIARQLDAHEQLALAALGYGEPQVEGGLVDQQLLALLQEALDRLSHTDSALRSRLLARLSLELTFSDEDARRDTLSHESVTMARRLGDECALSIACRARWMAVWGPDGLAERLSLSEEILRLARETQDRELELVGRARRITCALESGDRRTVEVDIAAYTEIAGELRMPYHEWTAATLRAQQALMHGTLETAETLAEEALPLLPGRPNARLAYLNQITWIRWEQDRLSELQTAWHDLVDRFPQAGFARGWLALIHAQRGQPDEARRHLDALVADLRERTRGGLWLPSVAVAALAATYLDDAEATSQLYSLLTPYADRTIVIPMPHPVTCFGSAHFYLGLLAGVLSRWQDAGAHLEAALHVHARLQARGLTVHTQAAAARVLLRQGQVEARARALALLDEAEDSARRLGLVTVQNEIAALREVKAGTPAAGSAPEAGAAEASLAHNVFRREGDYWSIGYGGTLVRLRDTKGLHYLARLLAEPGREFHTVDLEGEQNGRTPTAQPALRDLDELTERADLGDAGALLDAQAKAEYKARLQELEDELEEAEAWADPERAARARQERDFLIQELARAVGLGGRDRKAASHAERARLNVTRAIKTALANIAQNHPALGDHLHVTVRTGTYCVYSPDPRLPITWQL